jgi:hypothetical protein
VPASVNKSGAPWRDASSRLGAEFVHYELSRNEAHSVSLNLGVEVESAALARGVGAKRFLSDRISYHLDAALRRTSQFWFVLEETRPRPGRLHLHGEIECNSDELPRVREALRKAAGKWDRHAVQYQVDLVPDPDAGWVTYALKDQRLLGRRVRSRMGPASWRDDPFMITQDLKRRASVLYNSVRETVALSGYSHSKSGATRPLH